MTTSTTPGAQLVAQFTGSHEHFHDYDQIAAKLIADAATDPAVARHLVHLADHYVSHLHVHHTAEEAELFPAVRHAAPELSGAIDELYRQHGVLAEQLRLVRAASGALARADDDGVPDALAALSLELAELRRIVVDHLDFEEESIVPVIESWTAWPF